MRSTKHGACRASDRPVRISHSPSRVSPSEGDRGELALRDVSLTIRSGEIVGVAGVAGNGQRELAEALYGMRAGSAGSIRVAGRALRPGDPRAAIAAGVAHVPEDRLGTGLAPGLSVAGNVVLKSYRFAPVSRGPAPRPAADARGGARRSSIATT